MFTKSSQNHDKRDHRDPDTDYLEKKKKGVIFEDNSDPLSKLRKLAGQSETTFLTIRTIYPLDLFPDTVTVDANKVNIIAKELMGAEKVHSILIEDITNISVSTGVISATLEIVDSSNLRYPITYAVRHLKVKEAMLARRLIQGLVAAKRENIDLSSCEGKDVMDCLDILGKARGEFEEKHKKKKKD